jgi:hypothetical protein
VTTLPQELQIILSSRIGKKDGLRVSNACTPRWDDKPPMVGRFAGCGLKGLNMAIAACVKLWGPCGETSTARNAGQLILSQTMTIG